MEEKKSLMGELRSNAAATGRRQAKEQNTGNSNFFRAFFRFDAASPDGILHMISNWHAT
jgi:hypothetical protein